MQRTLIFIAGVVVAIVLLPVGAWATVTGTQMFLTDATTGKHAAIDSAGNVMTRVSNLATSDKFVHRHAKLTTDAVAVATPSARRTLTINELHIDWRGQNPAADQFVTFFVGDAGTCDDAIAATTEDVDLTGAQGFQAVAFTPGYNVGAGLALCANKAFDTGTVMIAVVGASVTPTP